MSLSSIKRGLLLIWLCPLALLFANEQPIETKQPSENQAIILMYHRFGIDKYPSTNIRLEQFDAHLEYLAQAGYQVWPLQKVVEHIQNNQPFPGKIVSITIDDAYLSVYTEAYPRMKNRGWPFTVFVATDGVDRQYHSYMSWQQMRELQNNGVAFANHSASHDYLVRLKPGENKQQWRNRVSEDIQRAQTRLTKELGETPMLFAYPYGEYNTALANLLTEQGYVAFGQQSGPAHIKGDTRSLPRFPMAEKFAALDDFQQKMASLAFLIEKESPWDPNIDQNNNPPKLEIDVANQDGLKLDQLTCFISGQGQVDVIWLDRHELKFSIQATAPLPVGRSRYNCTAPSSQKGRFYWYSHLWIRPAEDR